MCVCLYSTPLCYRTEKDKAPPSPHLIIYSDGLVHVKNDQVLVSTCRMHVYKFPFDIQSCNLSFKSVLHSGEPVTCCVLISSSLMCLPLFTFTVYCHLSTRHQITPHIPDIPSLLTSQFFYLPHQSKKYSLITISTLQRPQTGLARWCGPSSSGCSSTWQSPTKLLTRLASHKMCWFTA